MLCLVTNIKSFLIFPHLGSPKPDPAFQLFMNTWWYYYYSALLQINWNCHKALKSISPNPVLLHSLVLKIAAAVWQFSLNLSTCPKTGTLCVKVGPKPAFIPLSNSCIQSYNSPGLLVEYIINMQQDLSALFSQSLGASSNSENKNCATVVENCLYFYCSDHDLCLFFNEVLDKPRCQWFDLHKISKKQFYVVVMPSLWIAPVKPEWAVKRA